MPSLIDAFGPHEPQPLDSLIPHDVVETKLTAPGAPFEMEERVIRGVLLKTWKHLLPSLRDLWVARAKLYAKREYLVLDEVRATYGDIWRQSLLVAHWLQREFGVRKGDKVGIVMRNIPEYASAYWAIHLLGGVVVCLNAFSDADTLAFCIDDVQCRVLLCDPEQLAKLVAMYPKLAAGKAGNSVAAIAVTPRDGRRVVPMRERSWAGGKLGPIVHDWDELEKKWAPTLPSEAPKVEIEPEDDAIILFTSGTTSRPKGVLSTNRQSLSSLLNGGYGKARAFYRRGRALPQPGGDADQASSLLCVPLFHITGLHGGLTSHAAGGSKLVLMHTWDLEAAAEAIKREKCQGVIGIGFMIRQLLASSHDLSSLEMAVHGGASAAKEIPAEAHKKQSGMLTGAGYGLTETNGGAASHAGDDDYHHPTSIGLPPPTTELRVVNPDTFVTVKDGEEGELWIKSPGVARGYFNRPEATAEAFLPDGWFRTGDLAVRDPKYGHYTITGRAKETIIRGGENASTVTIEDAVYLHPGILDCVAVPLPCPELGERIAVVCVTKPEARGDKAPTPEDVIRVASTVLPKFSRPEYVWIRDSPLERNANGKFERKLIAKAVAERAVKEGWSAPLKSKL